MRRPVWLLVAIQLTLCMILKDVVLCGGLEGCFDKCDRMEKVSGTSENDIVNCYNQCYRDHQHAGIGKKSTPADAYDNCLMKCSSIEVNNDASKRLYEDCCRNCSATLDRSTESGERPQRPAAESTSRKTKSKRTGENNASSGERTEDSSSGPKHKAPGSADSSSQDTYWDCVKLMAKLHKVTLDQKPALQDVLDKADTDCDRREGEGAATSEIYVRCFLCRVEGTKEVYYGQLLRTVVKVEGKEVSDTGWFPNPGCDCR